MPKFWIPKSAKPKYRCRVCELVGEQTVFSEGEDRAYHRHVEKCSRRHEDKLRAYRQETRPDWFYGPSEGFHDCEYEAYVKRTGKVT